MQRTVALMLALLTLGALVPASATILFAPSATPPLTYYLHSVAPLGNAETWAEFAIGEPTPTMDEEPPTGELPKLMRATGAGNPEFRKNFLLGYWEGVVTGGRITDASATLWLSTELATNVTVTLFGDGGVGQGSSFGHATIPLERGTPAPFTFGFGDAAANVDAEIVLSVSAENPEAGVTIHYDAVGFASSLTFSLSDPVITPGPAWTPSPGWGPVTLINDSAAHRETSLVLSPVDPALMIACAPSGVPNTDAGQSYFHISRNGGTHWSYLQVETASTDPRRFAFEGGDCDVAFDAAGTMYSADTWLGSLSVGSSTDGGVTWTGTSLAASAPVVDRPWLVGGPEGVVHVTWQDVQFGMPSAIWYARSTDQALTFTPAVSVTTANADGGFTWTGNLVVAPNGQDLYSVYTRRQGPAIGDLDEQGAETVWVAASHDRGLTWTQNLVAAMPNPASYLYPSIGMDAGGQLHVVFSSKTNTDRPIWYARSTDSALTWSTPVKLLSGVAGWSPWVVGAGPGEAAIQWYGTLDPKGNLSADFDWYFFAARVAQGSIVSAGRTTQTPIFTGTSDLPEFNQIRLDANGKMHIGASAYYQKDGATGWALFYQRQV